MDSFLTAWDYAVIASTLVLSTSLGLYHGCFRSRQSTFMEYVLGSRSIPLFPIVMSSFAAIVSSGMIIGFPSEVYSFGCGTLLCIVVWLVIIPVTNYVFVPVYRQLDSGNIFQFYQIRFNVGVKKFATILYIVILVFFSSVTIFGPATALSLVTGLHVWIIISSMVGICMLYTILGGIRAVVFAETILGLELLVAIVVLITVGTITTGGIVEIWNRNRDGQRLQLDFSLDLTVTHGVWSSTVGWTLAYTSFFVNHQANIQRLMACKTLQQAQRANMTSAIIVAICQFLASSLGLLAYAAFFDCDPFSSGQISNMNQIVSFYIMKIFRAMPGLPGLYFAGLLSASLSTLSSVVNAMAAISVETFTAPPSSPKGMSDAKRTKICKILATIYGFLALSGIFLVEMFSNILQAAVNVAGTMTAPLFGLFLIGVFCPEANRKGCVAMLVLSTVTAIWLVTGGILYPETVTYKPLSVNGCESMLHIFNSSNEASTIPSTIVGVMEDSSVLLEQLKVLFPLRSISYLWLPMFAILIVTLGSLIFTYILGRDAVSIQFVKIIPSAVRRYHECIGPRWRHYLLCNYKMADCPTEDGCQPLQSL